MGSCFPPLVQSQSKAKTETAFHTQEKEVFSEAQGQRSPSLNTSNWQLCFRLHSSIYEHKSSPDLEETYCNVNSGFSKTFIVATTLHMLHFIVQLLGTAKVKVESALLEGNPCSGDYNSAINT